MTVFDYTDYRLFLADSYEAARARDTRVSHRSIARALGCSSSGFFAQILGGHSNVSEETARALARFFGLKKRETDYFLCMVAFNQARTHADKRERFEEMIAFNRGKVARVDAAQYEFYEKWYYTAVREMTALMDITDTPACHARVARALDPPVRPLQVKQAIRLLERLGLIRAGHDGVYQRAERVISTGYEARSVAVTNHVIQSMERARQALEKLPREVRGISNVTLSLSEKGYREVEERIKLFRRQLLEIAYRDREVDRVYQVNIQAVPLSKLPPKRKRGNT